MCKERVQYTAMCSNCGLIKNDCPLYCDLCGEPLDAIKLGTSWYETEDLNENNTY